MILRIVLSLSPFLGLVYVLYALIQALRHKRQGTGAAVLLLIAAGVPAAALLVNSESALLTRLVNAFALNAVIIFVASLVILLIERRNRERDANCSYGMLGVGLSLLFAVAVFVAPVISTTTTAAAEDVATGQGDNVNDTSLQNVRAMNSSTADETASDPAIETTSGGEDTVSPIAQILTEQTGLSIEELTSEIEAGSTIADLVAANGGDLDAVVAVISDVFDEMIANSGGQGQMLSRLGSDTATVATQIVEGGLPERIQQQLVLQLITGNTAAPAGGPDGAGSFAPPEGTPGAFPPEGGMPGAPDEESSGEPLDAAAPDAESGDGAFTANAPEASESQPVVEPTATPQPTQGVVRPTLIAFPTATATPVAEEITATEDSEPDALTCQITIDFNLNLRDEPSTEGAILLSIPFGTTVFANARSAGGWYGVAYAGETGWVSGDYVTAGASCTELQLIDGD